MDSHAKMDRRQHYPEKMGVVRVSSAITRRLIVSSAIVLPMRCRVATRAGVSSAMKAAE